MGERERSPESRGIAGIAAESGKGLTASSKDATGMMQLGSAKAAIGDSVRFRCDSARFRRSLIQALRSGRQGIIGFFLQSGEQFVIHAPALENLDGCSDAETGTHQRSEDASGFLVVDGLVEPLASQEGPRQLLFVDAGVGFVHSFLDYGGVDAFNFQVGDNATPAEFLVVAAKAGVSRGISGIAQVFLIFEARDHPIDGSLLLAPNAQLALELGHGMHAAPESADRIFVERGFIVRLVGTLERPSDEKRLAEKLAANKRENSS